MDNRAIGIFDSGLGGLTAAKEVRRLLPEEDLIYFGDTARVPYGSRSKETLLKYAAQDIRFLKTFDLKAIVVACGTVSTTALPQLQRENDLPIIGVVDPVCRRAAQVTRSGKVGLIATQASVRSGAYEACLNRLDPKITVVSRACPLFVPLVESGRIYAGDSVIESVAWEYLEPLKEQKIDTLILGCTHYPLLWDILASIMGPEVTLLSAGAESAVALEALLQEQNLLASPHQGGSTSFYVSDRPDDFERTASLFLQEDLHNAAKRIDIEQY